MTSSAPTRRQALTGNKAAAHALKLARVQVLCYFPIGPSDEVGEELSRMIQRGELPAEVIELEHERSVMNAQITATQSGARCSFATNSEGLLIAAQQLIFASYAAYPSLSWWRTGRWSRRPLSVPTTRIRLCTGTSTGCTTTARMPRT